MNEAEAALSAQVAGAQRGGLSAQVSLLRPQDQRLAHITSMTVGDTGRLLSGHSDGVVRVWRTQAEENGEPGICRDSMPPIQIPGAVTALCLSSSNSCASRGDQNGMISLWHIESGSVVPGPSMQEHKPVRSIQYTKSTSSQIQLLCASSGEIFLYDLRQKVTNSLQLDTGRRLTTAGTTGTLVAAGCSDGNVLFWDLRVSGDCQILGRKHDSPVVSLAFSRRGHALAGGFLDGSLTIWDTTGNMEQVSRSEWVGNNPVSSLAFSQSGSKLFVGAMGSVSKIDVADINESTETLQLEDWQLSAVKGMSPLGDKDRMVLVTTQPMLRTAVISMSNPLGWRKKDEELQDKAAEGDSREHRQEGEVPGHEEEPETVKEEPGEKREQAQRQGNRHDQDKKHLPIRKHSDDKEIICEQEGAELQLKEGMIFSSKDEAMRFAQQFCRQEKTAFVITSNKSGNGAPLVYKCKHGMKRASESKGKRPLQRTVKKDCPASFRFYVRVSGETILTNVNMDHENHAVSENIFAQDSAKADARAVAIIRQMLDGNCKVSNVKKALAAKGIHLFSNQIRYQIKKILGAPMNEEKLAELVKLVRDEGGHVQILRFPDGKIRVLSITTIKMKKGFIGSNPTVVQVDTTFGFERSGYKLNVILYRNPTTGKGEVAQVAFMADETLESHNFAFSGFKGIVNCDPAVIVIDKVKVGKYSIMYINIYHVQSDLLYL